jgi:hypothetical protein
MIPVSAGILPVNIDAQLASVIDGNIAVTLF